MTPALAAVIQDLHEAQMYIHGWNPLMNRPNTHGAHVILIALVAIAIGAERRHQEGR